MGGGIDGFEGGEFGIGWGKRVYVGGGWVMMGGMVIENVDEVKVVGRGMIEGRVVCM